MSNDLTTIGGVIDAAYASISGRAAAKRDWEDMRSLFAPGARLIRVGVNSSGVPEMEALDVGGFIEKYAGMLEADGFHESDIARRVERFGNIAHVLSTYEARRNPGDEQVLGRGVNSFQLFYDGTRWRIVTIYWQDETDALPIPQRYLAGEGEA